MSTQRDEHPIVLVLTRFAVPGLILLFYVTAVLRFEYTPETTFGILVAMAGEPVSSLWSAFLRLVSALGLEVLLAAKVFSMVFCSFAILFTYLIAFEVLTDRLAALCATLVVSMQAWLLQLAPSGSGAGAVLLLTLAAVFFLLRNDYLLAAIMAGLATLTSWQNVMLLPILVFDAYVNSRDRTRSMKVMDSIVLVFFSVVLPWVLYCLYSGKPIVPNEVGVTGVPTLFPQLSFLMVMLVGVMFVGVVVLASRERQLLRTHTALLLWIALAAFTHHVMFALVLPLVVVYAFFSLQHALSVFRRGMLAPVATIVLTAAILAYNQLVMFPATAREMDAVAALSAEVKSAALWLRSNTAEQEAVNAPDGYADVVAFYSARRVGDADARFLVTAQTSVDGFELVFDPVEHNPALLTGSMRYKVWRRR